MLKTKNTNSKSLILYCGLSYGLLLLVLLLPHSQRVACNSCVEASARVGSVINIACLRCVLLDRI